MVRRRKGNGKLGGGKRLTTRVRRKKFVGKERFGKHWAGCIYIDVTSGSGNGAIVNTRGKNKREDFF